VDSVEQNTVITIYEALQEIRSDGDVRITTVTAKAPKPQFPKGLYIQVEVFWLVTP
jgi:hypothetical protein